MSIVALYLFLPALALAALAVSFGRKARTRRAILRALDRRRSAPRPFYLPPRA